MNRRFLIGFASLLSLVSSVALADDCKQAPADFDDDRIYLLVKSGSESLRLYTDSGGGLFPFVYEDTARKLNMKIENTVKDGDIEIGFSTFPLEFEKLNIPLSVDWKSQVRVFKYDQNGKTESDQIRFILGDGFFGATLFAGKIWHFDYPMKRLSYCRSANITKAFSTIPMFFKESEGKRASHQPRIEIEIEGTKLQVLFDTGATSLYSTEAAKNIGLKRSFTSSSFIRASVAKNWIAKHPDWKVIKGGEKFSGGGDLIQVPQMKIAGHVIGPVWFATRKDDIYDRYSKDIMDSRIDGAVGGNVFKHFEIIADYPRAKLSFKLSEDSSLTKVPTAKLRAKLFDEFLTTVERLDGDGLIPRGTRPETWKQTTAKLKKEFVSAKSIFEMGQVLKRFDQTYTNLHAHITVAPELDFQAIEGRIKPAVSFYPEIVNEEQKEFRYRVSNVNKGLFLSIEPNGRPEVGDEVLAINGRPMKDWSRENLIYCKYPIREQCEIEFWDAFRKELRSWNRRIPLKYTLKRDKKTWTVLIPITGQTVQANSGVSESKPLPCNTDPKIYKPFELVYEGRNACAYEDKNRPGVVVIRITSFNYRGEHPKIKGIREDAKFFWENYWKKKAADTKKVVFDVSDNGGGDSVVSWYRLFFSEPFQEQYAQFKKIKELENPEIRSALFYEEAAKEIFYQSLAKEGTLAKISTNEFLPPVPQFCATDDKDCRGELFKPWDNGFKGEVRIVVNQWCHSSCVGFVWNMKHVLKDRVKFVGQPDNGDSTYGRVLVAVKLTSENAKGYEITIYPRHSGQRAEAKDGTLFEQAVSVTRSTDKDGKIVSAIPQKMDVWVPFKFDTDWAQWQNESILKAVDL